MSSLSTEGSHIGLFQEDKVMIHNLYGFPRRCVLLAFPERSRCQPYFQEKKLCGERYCKFLIVGQLRRHPALLTNLVRVISSTYSKQKKKNKKPTRKLIKTRTGQNCVISWYELLRPRAIHTAGGPGVSQKDLRMIPEGS